MREKTKLYYLGVFLITSALVLQILFFIELPVYDYWDSLYGNYALDARHASVKEKLSYAWKPFVDHRALFPRITIDLLRWLTNNRHYTLETVLGFLSRLAVLYLLWLFILGTDLSNHNKVLVWLAAVFLIFWPIQLPVLQLQWYSTNFGWCLLPGTLAVYCLQKFWGRWLGIVSAALACAVSAYSLANGVALWPAIGLSLLPQSQWSAKQKAAWWLISLAALELWMRGMPTRAQLGLPPLTAVFDSPSRGVSYFLKDFTPPLLPLILRPYLHTAVGLAILILCLLPPLLLLRQKRLFTKMAFPWLTLIVWCLGMAAMVTLGRSTVAPRPRDSYFLGQVLALIAAVPLWLTLYPNIWLTEAAGSMSYSGLFRSLLLGVALWIYLVGSEDGVLQARNAQRDINWGKSCLRYYPALDNHEIYLFSYNQLQRFKDMDLALLSALNAFPDYLNPTPFTIAVPTTFVIQEVNDMEVLEKGSDRFQFVIIGNNPSVVLKPSPQINRWHVVSFTMETSAGADVKFSWNDGAGWLQEKSIDLDRKGNLITRNSGYFPETDSNTSWHHVQAIR